MQVKLLYFFQHNNFPYTCCLPAYEKRTALCGPSFVPFKLLESSVIPFPFSRTVMNVSPYFVKSVTSFSVDFKSELYIFSENIVFIFVQFITHKNSPLPAIVFFADRELLSFCEHLSSYQKNRCIAIAAIGIATIVLSRKHTSSSQNLIGDLVASITVAVSEKKMICTIETRHTNTRA